MYRYSFGMRFLDGITWYCLSIESIEEDTGEAHARSDLTCASSYQCKDRLACRINDKITINPIPLITKGTMGC